MTRAIVRLTITMPDGELLEIQTFAKDVDTSDQDSADRRRLASYFLAGQILDLVEQNFETVEG